MATFYNQATLTYNGITLQSNTTSGEITNVLTVQKNALDDNYTANSTIVYSVSIVNSGTTPFSNITLTDNLGAYAFGTTTLTPLTYAADDIQFYVNGVLQPKPTVTAGPPMVISGINIPAGGSAVLVYRANVNNFAQLAEGAGITNTLTATGAGIADEISDSETINASAEPVLSIIKSLNPTNIAGNGPLTYTFTIENYGTQAAGTDADIAISDTFDPPLSGITVTLNGTNLALTTDYNYTDATGVFSTVPGVITVPAATVTQDTATGIVTVTPGVSTLTVTGTV